MIYWLNQIETNIAQFETKNPTFAPACYQLVATLCFSVQALTVKLLTRIPTAQILIIRSIVCMVINGVIINKKSINSYPVENGIGFRSLLMRGIFGGLSTQLRFEGVRILPLSESSVLLKSTPIWTTLIAVLILKQENFTRKMAFSMGICSFGILLIARPPQFLNLLHSLGQAESYQTQSFNGEISQHTLGVLLCLSASMIGSVIQIVISSMSGKISQFLLLQYFSFFTIVLATMQLFYSSTAVPQVPTLLEAVILFLIGLMGCFAQWFMNRSFLLGNLTQMSLLGQFNIVWNVLLDVLVLHEDLLGLSIIGVIFILSCAIFEVSQKKIKTPELKEQK